MKRSFAKPRTRLGVERLEDRATPALTADFSAGVLTITGVAMDGPINITQDSTAAGSVRVSDGPTTVGQGLYSGVTSIHLDLTRADDTVNIDLGGQTLSADIAADIGAGANTLTLTNGTLNGTLGVCGDHGFNGYQPDVGRDTITLATDAVANNLIARIGAAGATVEINGHLSGYAVIGAFNGLRTTAGTAVTVPGSIDGTLVFIGSYQSDVLAVTGTIGRSLLAATYGGNDLMSVGGTVGDRLILDTGADQDAINLNGSVGGETLVVAGQGNDVVTIKSGAQLSGPATVLLGQGNDRMVLESGAQFSSLFVDGGLGLDVFVGANQPGVHRVGF